MNRISKQMAWIGAGFTLAVFFSVAQASQGAPAPVQSSDQENLLLGWPRLVTTGQTTLTVYQPQLDSWQGNHLTGRAVVAVQTPNAKAPIYGVIWFSARTEVDKAAGLVTLQEIQITRSTLPNASPGGPDYVQLLQQHIPRTLQTVPLEQLEANLSITRTEKQQRKQTVRNDPPRILYAAGPAVLVIVDGEPTMRKVEGTDLLRVINTPALILLDQGTRTYYLYLMDRWMQAPSLQGPWSASIAPPASLETAKQAAIKAQDADLFDNPAPEVKQALSNDVSPVIYISTVPAELVVTQGAPDLQSIAGTTLIWVKNTRNSIFINTTDQNYYVLISGRWYRSRTLEKGTWTYIAGISLPGDFARIPVSHPAGDALPSVAGTTAAVQVAIAHTIPQTATVKRDAAQITITYDGEPRFVAIENTSLQYAVNTAIPVILTDDGRYYACDNAVWFTGVTPTGPWIVATSVPAVIYTIPITCPINYVTNTYIYGYTPLVVYTGYTPGYLGTYMEPYGCVVFGSGYVYHGWVGDVWFGPPATFGLGVAFDWDSGFGWSFGFGFGWGPVWHPWWGPFRDHWRDHDYWVDNWRRDHGPWRWRDANLNHYNVYNRWDHHMVVSHYRAPSHITYRVPGDSFHTANNLYAGRDGNVYLRGTNGWRVREGNQWRPVASSTAPTDVRVTGRATLGGPEPPGELNRERQARDMGQRWTLARAPGLGIGPPDTGQLHISRPTISGSNRTILRPAFTPPPTHLVPSFPSFGGSFGGFGRRSGFEGSPGFGSRGGLRLSK
jgi:hypothetical protein